MPKQPAIPGLRDAMKKKVTCQSAFMYTLIVSAKMNEIDPQAWLADVLARLPDMPVSRVHELLPWHWKAATELKRIAA